MLSRLLTTLMSASAVMFALPVAAQLSSAVTVQYKESVAPTPGSWKNLRVNCPAGYSVLSGSVDHDAVGAISLAGFGPTFGNVDLFFQTSGTYTNANGWVAAVRNEGNVGVTVAVSALCAPVSTAVVVSVATASDGNASVPTLAGGRLNCPAGYMATGGGIDIERPATMSMTGCAPTYNNNFISELSLSATSTPASGWASYVRNAGLAGKVVNAAVCTPTVTVLSKFSGNLNVAGNTNRWFDPLNCDAGSIALGGGVDSTSLGLAVMSASAAVYNNSSQVFQANGTYVPYNGRQNAVRNTTSTLITYNNAVICANVGSTTPANTVLVIEFYNSDLRHYFRTASQTEAASIDAGAAGRGWARTGDNFRAYAAGSGLPGYDVCRFYTFGANSHFYTANANECALLKAANSGWVYEGLSFNIEITFGSGCAAGRVPVYRAYNNRGANVGLQDANHRFTTSLANINALVAQGWVNEGIAFCALPN